MNILRKLALGFLAPFLSVLLFTAALAVGVNNIVGTPGKVKHIVAESGVYNTILPNALQQAKTVETTDGDVALTDPTIKKAAEQAFSPQFIQQSAEKAIDGTFDWLNGKTAAPEFKIDLSGPKQAFAASVGQSAADRAATLPKCAKTQSSINFDAFNATCLPIGITPQIAGTRASSDILTGQGFIDQPTITAKDIKNGNSNQPVFNTQLKQVPTAYQKSKKAPAVLILLSILTILAVIFLSVTRRKGLKHVGIILISAGIFMLVFAWALNYGVAHQLLPKLKLDNAVLQTDVKKLITDIAHSIEQNYYLFGGVYAALGILAIFLPMFFGQKAPKIAAGAPNGTPAATAPAASAPAAPTRPTAKPKPRPTKIQG